MLRSKYLCDFELKNFCMGPPNESCENAAERLLVFPEHSDDEHVDITVLFVCETCALVWHAAFSERDKV